MAEMENEGGFPKHVIVDLFVRIRITPQLRRWRIWIHAMSTLVQGIAAGCLSHRFLAVCLDLLSFRCKASSCLYSSALLRAFHILTYCPQGTCGGAPDVATSSDSADLDCHCENSASPLWQQLVHVCAHIAHSGMTCGVTEGSWRGSASLCCGASTSWSISTSAAGQGMPGCMVLFRSFWMVVVERNWEAQPVEQGISQCTEFTRLGGCSSSVCVDHVLKLHFSYANPQPFQRFGAIAHHASVSCCLYEICVILHRACFHHAALTLSQMPVMQRGVFATAQHASSATRRSLPDYWLPFVGNQCSACCALENWQRVTFNQFVSTLLG